MEVILGNRKNIEVNYLTLELNELLLKSFHNRAVNEDDVICEELKRYASNTMYDSIALYKGRFDNNG